MLPVAELHVHIEGTLEPELLVSLAARNEVALPTTDVAELRARYGFDDLQSFLEPYYEPPGVAAGAGLLRPSRRLPDPGRGGRGAPGRDLLRPADAPGHGVPLAAVFGGLTAALADGAARHGISADLIFCFLRDLGATRPARRCATRCPSGTILGVGLDSAEMGYPPALFAEVYQLAAPRDCGWWRMRGRRPARTTCARRSTCCT